MPGFLKSIAWPVLCLSLVTLLLLLPQPVSGRIAGAIMDLCHGPLFAVLAAVMCWSTRDSSRLPPKWRGLLIWFLLSAFGLFAEALQGWVSRHPSWQDAVANMLGAAAGVLWMQSKLPSPQKAITRFLAALLLLGSAAYPLVILADALQQHRQLPLLASFETPWELTRWSVRDCELKRVRAHATDGAWAIRIDMQTEVYPGVEYAEVPRDWTPYRELALDVTLDHPQSLSLIIKIYDEAHNQETTDRFHHVAELKKGMNVIRIALKDVENAPYKRRMDLSRIRVLQLFCVRPPAPARVYVDNIRLVPKPSSSL